ncbi:MAG: hypothetical protein ACRC2T_02465 [Thermoguttaceae bacterium]
MTRFSDYLYASIPSVCLAVPLAQWMPDLSFLQGVEKLGIIGILAAGIIFFVTERRSFISKSMERLEEVEHRLLTLENQVASGNDRVVHLLGEQLETLQEIKNGQAENFNRMWQLAIRSINGISNGNSDPNGFQVDEEILLRPKNDPTSS